jgi:hypothetical protein
MKDVEEQILSYPHLSAEEQREVEAYVESNPEWADLLRDVRSIEHLSANVQADLPSDALLATYVMVQHLHPEEVPPGLQGTFSELEARIEDDASLQRKVDAARRRLQAAESAIDPVSHFEALTEHELETEAAPERTGDPEPESSAARRTTPSLLEVFLNLPRLARRGAVVVIVLVGAYGVLYGASQATQSTLDRLAVVEVSDQVVENYADAEMRSPMPETDTVRKTVDDRYLDALSALQEARVSTLGLFPRYDAKALNQADRRLNEVLAQVEPGSFLALEAHFYLGKIALAQKEVDAARRHFKAVVKGEGRRAEEAYEILKTLQQEQVAGGG